MLDQEGTKKNAVSFLIAEYNEIAQETRRLRQEGITRLNFFITITSSFLAVLVFLSQSKATLGVSFQIAAVGVLLLLLLIGLDTFDHSIRRDVYTDFNVRAMARIRCFFATQSPEIKQYLTWQYHDEPTLWVTRNNSNVRKTVQYIISSICALTVGLMINLIGANPIISTIVGGVVLVVAFIGFRGYASKRFKQASIDAEKSTRFPIECVQIGEVK
ncbi:hypothetical protein B9G53_08975 [Pseudanabaena sp. SR411]|uniref:hypothetical protein n=1 Tax=Pseudanabaena sp. SR411 TaxID=1980935 RepID=UPI000B9988F3|nr:hypothetical protein [Pseudanabaena sp. SR411]OYQ65072.1 hypothetical protein B9G53_08975 [Pseudanabaena sp. SR411]